MKLLLISTCGTSLLTNRAPAELRNWFTDIANRRALSTAEEGRLAARLRDCTSAFMEANDEARRDLSAEMAGIDAVLEQLKPERVQHVLIHTDTAIGEAASAIVAEGLLARGDNVVLLTAGGLRTDDLASFREALADLTGGIEQFAAWRADGWTIYFNLTGGFKSINGYLQALGMIHADRCVFLFERSATLMEIPRLPVRLSEIEDLSAHLTVFRRLACGYPVSRSAAEGIPEALLLADGDRVTTSVWGDVVWVRGAKTLLAARLLEPLSPHLAFSRAAQTDFDKHTAEARVAFNTALDALSAHLDGQQAVLKSHTFKKLQGDPTPPSSHELYVRLEAKRIYGHYEDDRFVVDRFGSHL